MLRAIGLAMATSLAVLITAGAAANAQTFRFEPSGAVRLASEGQLTFSDASRAFAVSCNTTLGGSLTSSEISVVPGTRFGELTEAGTESCSGGTITFLLPRERPWQLAYESARGELPDLMREFLFNIREFAFLASVTVLGVRVSCLYRGSAGASVSFAEPEENPYNITTFRLTGNSLERVSGGATCPSTAIVTGTLRFNATQKMQVRPRFTWNPYPLNFGDVRVSDPARIISVRAENTTGSSCTVASLVIGGGGSYSYDTNLIRVNEIILNGQSREIRITFRPTGTGFRNTSFTINCSALGPMAENIFGRGI
jgi:hypothetical protein